MASMTYNSLLADLRRYLERGFTAGSDPIVYDQLPSFVSLAELRCATELKIQGFIQAVTTTLEPEVAVLTKPDRWRDTVSMRAGQISLFPRSYEYLRNYWPDETVTGTPQFYADYDYQHWLILPTPAANMDLEIIYYELPPPLSNENQQNWLTNYAPNLLLYASLLEASPFLKRDERIPVWQGLYDTAKNSITGQDLQKMVDRSSMRNEA